MGAVEWAKDDLRAAIARFGDRRAAKDATDIADAYGAVLTKIDRVAKAAVDYARAPRGVVPEPGSVLREVLTRVEQWRDIASSRKDNHRAAAMTDVCDEIVMALRRAAASSPPVVPPTAEGVFACPVCGEEGQHAHDKSDIRRWLKAQASRFGYTLTSFLGDGPAVSRSDCRRCGGSGTIEYSVKYDEKDTHLTPMRQTCPLCEGTGNVFVASAPVVPDAVRALERVQALFNQKVRHWVGNDMLHDTDYCITIAELREALGPCSRLLPASDRSGDDKETFARDPYRTTRAASPEAASEVSP